MQWSPKCGVSLETWNRWEAEYDAWCKNPPVSVRNEWDRLTIQVPTFDTFAPEYREMVFQWERAT